MMPNFLRLHFTKLFALIFMTIILLLLYFGSGNVKPVSDWVWTDIIGEGGSALLAFIWLCLILKSRPAGRVTNWLMLGLSLMFISWWVDCLDEFIYLADSISWDHWLESIPMACGFLFLTYGIYHWHNEQLAISAQLKKRERLFREHLHYDNVIPLAGAQYLRQQLQISMQHVDGISRPLSLIALDIDNFDSINQKFGHNEGDVVLQAVSQLIVLNLRQQDLLCRLAGDRFVVLLPDTHESQAQLIAGELTASINYFAYKTQNQGERLQLHVTTAVVMAVDESPDQLLERLNLSLSRSKNPLTLRA